MKFRSLRKDQHQKHVRQQRRQTSGHAQRIVMRMATYSRIAQDRCISRRMNLPHDHISAAKMEGRPTDLEGGSAE
jgi:hypothetical protein